LLKKEKQLNKLKFNTLKRNKTSDKGAIIMIAWPKTPAIQVGSWYEGLMRLLGFNKNGYYMAGHSAIVLIKPKNGELNYFDFGRYHAPLGYGRARDKITDPDLDIDVKAKFDDKGVIINLHEILLQLDANKEAFHGKNTMYASVFYGANVDKAYEFAKTLQSKGAIPYGPFETKGTNCSRFTSSVFRAGDTGLAKNLRLVMPTSLTPTTLGNVLIASNTNIFYEIENNIIKEQPINFIMQLKNWIIPIIKIKRRRAGERKNEKIDSKTLIKA